jgi:hypothetical protein
LKGSVTLQREVRKAPAGDQDGRCERDFRPAGGED